ncbi:hypothetical protein COU57_00715 [Candidatus Pacearchaeota archaeon CG10_big_fil_rev_8_21_14_0_10_32_14]|nr:MAG: hypothetical protein COU57_00715 [Candidatus Pacearchaeota archaeon CG10_big_fil_rev_8_21_14_0_10_32_14]
MKNDDNSKLRGAFQKVKEDYVELKKEVESIKAIRSEIDSLKSLNLQFKNEIIHLCDILIDLSKKVNGPETRETISFPHPPQIPSIQIPLYFNQMPYNLPSVFPLASPIPQTNQQTNPTDVQHPQHINPPLNDLKSLNNPLSIGNRGVPTDRQTDRPTDQQVLVTKEVTLPLNPPTPFESVSNILDNLDGIKKEIRLKFKRLTEQETLVFSTIYQLEEEKGYTDYKEISDKLSLTESSIRDYVGRLLKKGIPIEKNKINNKIIHLTIAPPLKKIASLSTIIQLKDL